MTTQHISLLAYPGCMGMEVFGLSDTLLLANRVAQAMEPGMPPLFTVGVISLAGGEIAAVGMVCGSARSARRVSRAACWWCPAWTWATAPPASRRRNIWRPKWRTSPAPSRGSRVAKRVRGRLPAGRG
ncbi:hypothetical protein LP419_08705 [Massilia sp. H-1]|nr:hypothetical protein LP419_08705 [Massilia sp. H-1]